MPRKKKTYLDKIVEKTIEEMVALGTYKAEYNRIISIYAELVEQYEIMTKKFKDSDYQYEVFTGDGGTKKSPIVATLESLRKDIASYSDRLGLNPKAMDSVKVQKKETSALAKALSGIK